MMFDIHIVDYFIGLVYLILGYPILYLFFKNNFTEAFKAYTFKAIFSYAFCLIYILYYGGGDTFFYWKFSAPYFNILFEDFSKFLRVMIEPPSSENFYLFTNKTGYPYWHKGANSSLFMFKLIFFFRLLGFENYIAASQLISLLTFIVNFKFYLFIKKKFNFSEFKYLLLYVPSLTFWSSGILKDTITFSSTIVIIYCFYKFYEMELKFRHILYALFAFWMIILLKPYIFLSLLPALLIWFYLIRIKKISTLFSGLLILPLLTIFIIFIFAAIFYLVSPYLGSYSSVELITTKAHVSYNDLKQDYYGGNSFDLGYYDPTISGMLSKFFPAVIAGLFRPFIWESRNIGMVFSGLENFFMLLITLYTLFKTRFRFIKLLFSDPFLVFCFVFSITLAFSIAISTSNFGALVRFKIPLIPFYMMMLFILIKKSKMRNKSIN